MAAAAFARMDLRCPRAFDPRPTWTLSAEVDALQGKATHRAAPPKALKQPPEWAREKAFVMRVEEEDDISDEDAQALVTTGTARFSCNDLDLSSEESGDESGSTRTPCHLMEKMSLEKSTLLELERQHRLKIQEEVRSKLSSLDFQNEIQGTISASARLQDYAESRKELDRSLDVQFQRKIAQVLDEHLSMVQMDHEQKSQIAERRIRDDAAVEEGKRREQSLKEEKIKAEARQKAAANLAAEAQKAAHEAAKKEAVEKEAAKSRAEAVCTSSQIPENNVATMANSTEIKSELPGIKVYADSSALKAESRRRALHDQAPSNIYLSKEYSRYDRQIGKYISKLMPTTDCVEARASELIKALDGQDCPRPIACRLFADKMISIVKSRNPTDKTFEKLAFACGYVMLLVTDQIPDAMDYLLAEFHKVCMYTVPKHLHALNAQARNTDYFRLIGYKEEDG